MFSPKTDRIKLLAEKYPAIIAQLDEIFDKSTNIYIDYANVIHWHNKLGWHIALNRLKQLFDSFGTIKNVKFYTGKLNGDEQSEKILETANQCQYIVRSKPVKIMKLSIDVSGIEEFSPSVLKSFIDKQFLAKMNLETIILLNNYLRELNKQGIKFIEKRKCNFDVEISRDILRDFDNNIAENFILWSGDSDFAEPISELMAADKKVVLCSTARRTSFELEELKNKGLFIYDIQKIREFICFAREMAK